MAKRKPKTSIKARKIDPLSFRDMMNVKRLSHGALSPDGKELAFVKTEIDLEKDSARSSIYLLDIDAQIEKELTPGPGNHTMPTWSQDGQTIAFVSTRNSQAQIWCMPRSGGEAEVMTSGDGGIEALCFSPDGKTIAFSREVIVSKNYSSKKEKPTTGEIYGLVNTKSSAKISDTLLFRHWDRWRDRKRKHIFFVDIETKKIKDITPGDWDAPPLSLGSARDFDFSPNGKYFSFVANPDEVVARSTNNSVFLQKLSKNRPSGVPLCISTSEACDCQPRFSKDSQTLFYLAMKKPGYEADKQRIKAYHIKTNSTKLLLDRFDRSPSNFQLIPTEDKTNRAILFSADDLGYHSLYQLDVETNRVLQLTTKKTISLALARSEKEIIAAIEATHTPKDFFLLTIDQSIKPQLKTGGIKENILPRLKSRQLTYERDILDNKIMNAAEEFWYKGADKDDCHGFIIKPPGFKANRKYPLIVLIHGGPQGAFSDQFHYRWNAQLFASKGAIVAMFNPRGSTGYGQRFTDQISKDWSGRAYTDLMRGVDYLIKTYSFINPKKIGAAGASFGGYMVNWIAGHSDRFCTLVSHDGVFNSETMAYTTEELWFDEHEHGGFPHQVRQNYLKSSPHLHVKKFKTPMLVIQGEQDFRCPISEGIGLFTALQMMNVPSRYLHFPDEGHWVQRPSNAEVWYDQVLAWLMHYLS